MSNHKICTQCENLLPYSAFSKNDHCIGGVLNICRSCRSIRRKAERALAREGKPKPSYAGPNNPKYIHGMTKSPEHGIWEGMRKRCRNETEKCYKDYGGRGIKVCERWSRFENFYADMGPRPSPKHSIDRINVDGDYEPGNCKWSTRREQSINRRTTKLITYKSVTMSPLEWAEVLGVSLSSLFSRITRGWATEEIIEVPYVLGAKRRSQQRVMPESVQAVIAKLEANNV